MRILTALLVMSSLLGADRVAIGLTSNRALIEGFSGTGTAGDLPKVIIVAGLDGDPAAARIIRREVDRIEASDKLRRRFQVIAVPLANPAKAKLSFPPAGTAYRENPEANYLWRWLGMEAPDLVLVAGEDFGLAPALSSNNVAGVGTIPARRVALKTGLLDAVEKVLPPSEARLELERRFARTPRQVAAELARYYGHELNEAVYIPAVALMARLRMGEQADVERIAAPYIDGSRNSLAKPTSSHLAGHLLFADLAERTADARYVERVRAAADIAMPLHNEMSDAVFMGCPILAKAGKLTGDGKYFDKSAQHLRFLQKLCLRGDGLYRHSPLDEAAWGRGNAFPALGLALALTDFPKEHDAYEEMVRAFQNHMAALARHQDPSGMWREVIDQPGAYRELSATAMIGVAMLRGIRHGWLDANSYRPRVERAWRAVLARTGSDGALVDVCESTGKQTSLDAYLQRTAIFGKDPRGGAMVLYFATEMMQ